VEQLVPNVPTEARGSYAETDFVGSYLADLALLVDGRAIAAARPHVVVDPMYGSGTDRLAETLGSLGCVVTQIHGGWNEDFGGIHPEPANPWADDCEQTVVSKGADLGVLLDGDGDRAALVDETGRILSPHELAPLILGYLVEGRGERGRVVITLSCSASIVRQAERLGCEHVSVPVGFTRIYREMLEGDVLLGAEEYGGLSVPAHLRERDGLLVCLLAVELVARARKPLSALVGEMRSKIGRMCYTRRDVRMDSAATQAFRMILPGLNPESVAGKVPVEVSHADGLKLQFEDDSWVLMRPSRTDSVVRVYAEAPTEGERDALLEATCSIVRSGV
jgi:phosphomannomutase